MPEEEEEEEWMGEGGGAVMLGEAGDDEFMVWSVLSVRSTALYSLDDSCLSPPASRGCGAPWVAWVESDEMAVSMTEEEDIGKAGRKRGAAGQATVQS